LETWIEIYVAFRYESTTTDVERWETIGQVYKSAKLMTNYIAGSAKTGTTKGKTTENNRLIFHRVVVCVD